MTREWNEYRDIVLPLLEHYRNDETLEGALKIDSFLRDMDEFTTDVKVHMMILELIWEKPSVRDLDRFKETNTEDEYDRILDAIRTSHSFEEANRRAEEIWGY